jgi:hypothetical protein
MKIHKLQTIFINNTGTWSLGYLSQKFRSTAAIFFRRGCVSFESVCSEEYSRSSPEVKPIVLSELPVWISFRLVAFFVTVAVVVVEVVESSTVSPTFRRSSFFRSFSSKFEASSVPVKGADRPLNTSPTDDCSFCDFCCRKDVAMTNDKATMAAVAKAREMIKDFSRKVLLTHLVPTL